MNILITSATSELGQELAAALRGEHEIRLTDSITIDTDLEFTVSDLGHCESTNDLVREIDAIVHLATPPANSVASDHIDHHTRCTYNLLMAAAEENVPRLIYASTLDLLEAYAPNLTVTERWRPRPSPKPPILARHLGEMVCREFVREHLIQVICLRLGKIVREADVNDAEFDPTWVEIRDVAQAFNRALTAELGQWSVFHIQSDAPDGRFNVGAAKEVLDYAPQFDFRE